ncbi:Ribonuclease H domain [Arabidopsis thaliana x Arabidopsis arenosa]|uniref:Ribonuclease H domain n=1 Tax=Arabidopsis thaliana x Arabidopsis arenosa TaxID=1240361 RepID=A0A8T2APP1_9BRAS|nr:Ribonuclease H domain [Arabidopsis thaliana x Arabidopsis arenosa]
MAILKRDMVSAHREEESFWSQKSRQKWANSGDKNTKFFHASVKAERNKNGLEKLIDEEGATHCSEASKGDVAAKYFQHLFSSSYPVEDDLQFFQDFVPRVSPAMNDSLCAEVTKEEVRAAVFSIKPSSAPGSDGMTGVFFQHYWDIIGGQITEEVLGFFRDGVFQKEWNLTQLCLIPKKENASVMVDLRPISLCSVMYKIISKILVSRLKPFLGDIVSPNQSAFVEERLISDNILIAHEVVHGLRTHLDTSKAFMAVKTDMSKAFDRVEWSYLRSLLSALGFNAKWVDLVMICVTTVSYTVLINGQPFGLVVPERGLRQGDPLSPFLFVLCTEGLTHLLNKAELEGKINGLQFSPQGPSIHHLLFADDTLFVCKAEVSQCETIQDILETYGRATGQIINKEKSSITFGAKIDDVTKDLIKRKLLITNEGGAGTYLGLPECFSGSKKDMLEFIHERLKNKLSGWFARSLSQGGKEILIKSVAMAMPVYAMSCFKLPKATCTTLTSAISSFWWSTMEHHKKIHWVAWDKMCLPKELGGMGFKDIEVFNQALLAKQAWRLLHFPNCLFARFFKSRYFEDCQFLQAVLGSRPSFAWRSILHGRVLLRKGLRQGIGDGASTSVWTGQWLMDGRMRAPLMKNIIVDLELLVEDLIDPVTKTWDPISLQEHFYQRDIDIISKLKPVVSCPDFMVWQHNKSGEYSVRSGYWLASKDQNSASLFEANAQPSTNAIKELTWDTMAPSKLKVFMWKAISGAIPVADKLASRGISLDSRCQVCGLEGESINHLLFVCTLARQVWAMMGIPSPVNGFVDHALFHNLHYVLMLAKNPKVQINNRRAIPWILWLLWKNRNNLVFEGMVFLVTDLVNKIKEDAEQWFLAQQIEKVEESRVSQQAVVAKRLWRPPEKPWLKCNIAFSWDKDKLLCGAAWVLRNSLGTVLLHSRRAFSPVSTKLDAEVEAWLWAVESMKSLKIQNVCFAADSNVLISAILRPSAWPSFKFQTEVVSSALGLLSCWKLCIEDRSANRGASLIANSVTKEDRLQSYVASGYPFWLKKVFTDEMCIT